MERYHFILAVFFTSCTKYFWCFFMCNEDTWISLENIFNSKKLFQTLKNHEKTTIFMKKYQSLEPYIFLIVSPTWQWAWNWLRTARPFFRNTSLGHFTAKQSCISFLAKKYQESHRHLISHLIKIEAFGTNSDNLVEITLKIFFNIMKILISGPGFATS